jgi:hypothetical protein
MLNDFAIGHQLSDKRNVRQEQSPLFRVSADFDKGNDFLRVYYLSDGSNVAVATYLCDRSSASLNVEIAEADLIVRSVTF